MTAPKHAPIRLVTAPVDPNEQPSLVELFSIDGKPYMVDSRPRLNLALLVIDDIQEYGPGVAEAMMLRRAIGPTAFKALAAHRDLQPGQLAQIATAVTQLTLGALEESDATAMSDADVDAAAGEGLSGNSSGSAAAEPSSAA